MKIEEQDSPELKNLKIEIENLHKRLTALELSFQNLKTSNLISGQKEVTIQETEFEFKLPFHAKGSLESGVGEYGMAWIGNIVLLFGVTFLVQYLQNKALVIFSFFTGFLSIAAIYSAAFFTRNSYSYLSKLLSYNGHILLFYFSIHLHFFEINPIIENKAIGLALTLLVVTVLFYIAWRRRSKLMMFMVLIMLLITGIIANSAQFLNLLSSLTAVVVVYLFYRFKWQKIYFSFIFLTYFSYWIWLVNNPFMGNSFELISSPGYNFLFVFITGLAFSIVPFFPKDKQVSVDFIVASIVFNGLGFTSILLMSTFTFYLGNYILLYSVIVAFCLAYSILIKWRTSHKIIASMYALYGFLAMSVVFYGIYGIPSVYLLFALQSLLVVSMALWFRSRFILIMNTFLYFVLLIFYLNDDTGIDTANFAFTLVAFITARIINWKKERLNIKTEVVRNFYLLAGFAMTLFSLYKAVPTDFITVAWIVGAVLFFLLSLVLKNIKYRWLAIAAVIATSIRLIFIDMSNIDIGYRVLVFLGLAIISIIVSVLYTRFYRKKKN